jgi:predicted DsbA family dithiol-disulfide isomerase
MTRRLRIEMGYDLVCPWCLIGLRHLREALRQLRDSEPGVDVELAWRGVQLLPHIPPDGLPFMAFYRQRLGSDRAVRERQAMVMEAAAAAGASILYSRIERMPNTAKALRLMELAQAQGGSERRDALLDSLFVGYFERGDQLGCANTLLAHAAACGYEPAAMAAAVEDERPYANGPHAANGVPYFIVNGQLAGSGAMPAAALLASMQAALGARDQ